MSTRDIEDGEEIWLNYRLLMYVMLLVWYVCVDLEEDECCWLLD